MHTFFERLDTAGQKPTIIDRELAAATVELARGNLREAQKHVTDRARGHWRAWRSAGGH
jgi:hypothetical protein